MILYASKNGAVEEFVERVRAAISDDRSGPVFNLLRDRKSAQAAIENLEETRVLLIAPIYAGSIPGGMRRFIDLNREALERHEIALGLSCLYEGEQAIEQLHAVYPSWLTARAVHSFLIGGRIIRSQLSFPVRLLISKILGQDDDVDTLRFDLANEAASWLAEDT